jgi:hypothetical protein
MSEVKNKALHEVLFPHTPKEYNMPHDEVMELVHLLIDEWVPLAECEVRERNPLYKPRKWYEVLRGVRRIPRYITTKHYGWSLKYHFLTTDGRWWYTTLRQWENAPSYLYINVAEAIRNHRSGINV